MPVANPARRLTLPQQLYLSLYWFGLNFHWGALLAVAIPAQVLKFVAEADKGHALATVFAGGAFVALVVMPLAGALSDRSLSRFGRRRPFIVAGALLNSLALLALGYTPAFPWFIAAYWFVQFANNFGGSAYSALIPDLVPSEQRGSASGVMGLMTMLGTSGAAWVAGKLMQREQVIPLYLTIIAVLLVTMAITVWKVQEEPLTHRPPLHLAGFLAGLWVNPRQHPNFAWLFLARFLTGMGFYTLLNFLQYLLKDYMRIALFTEATGNVIIAVVIGALPSALVAGWLSDRIGRRAIVSFSTLIMGTLCLGFLTAPSYKLMLALGVIFGVGYGANLSVDWALGTDVLPSRASAAKDLGIWGISFTLPQVLAPLIGGPLLDTFNQRGANQGYIVLMVMAAVYFVIASATIWRIRGVK